MDIYHTISKDVTGTYTRILSDFQEFMYSNNVLVAATGWCVGMATKEVIEKVLNHLVLPIIHFLLKFNIWHILYLKALDHYSKTSMAIIITTFGNLIWDIFVWVVVIFLTFLILEYILNRRIIGLKSSVKDDSKTDFVKSKAEAQQSIIPVDREEFHKIMKKDEIEKIAGEKLIDAEEKKMEMVAKQPLDEIIHTIEGYSGHEHFSFF